MNKQTITRHLALLLLLLSAVRGLGRVSDGGTDLVLRMSDGTTVRYQLADRPQVTFGATTLEFYSPNFFSATYERSNVADISFQGTAQSVDAAGADELRIDYRGADRLLVSGLAATDRISVFTLDGKSLGCPEHRSGRQAEVSLSSLPTGYYIITINQHHSFKIFRKQS